MVCNSDKFYKLSLYLEHRIRKEFTYLVEFHDTLAQITTL